MKKITLTLAEAFELEAEIQNLLAVKATIRLKYELTSLLLKIKARSAAGREVVQSIFKEHGKPGGKDTLYLDEGTQPFKDYNELLQKTVDELDYQPLQLDWFDKLESDHNFPLVFKLIAVHDNH